MREKEGTHKEIDREGTHLFATEKGHIRGRGTKSMST